MNPYFSFVPTVNPAEFGIALKCSDADLVDVRLPAPGTLYQDVDVKTAKPRVGEFGRYKFTHFTPGPEPGISTFYFVRPKTEAEKYKPFRTTPGKQSFTWPRVLLKAPEFKLDPELLVYQDPHNLFYSGDTGIRRMWVKETWVDELTCESDVVIEEFLSDEPYPREMLATRAYVQTPVEYNYPGCDRRGFPACIHGDLDMPGYEEPYIRQVMGSEVRAMGYTFPPRRIHATPMATWMPHVWRDNQVLTEDLQYHRTRITIYPPAMPRIEETLG